MSTVVIIRFPKDADSTSPNFTRAYLEKKEDETTSKTGPQIISFTDIEVT